MCQCGSGYSDVLWCFAVHDLHCHYPAGAVAPDVVLNCPGSPVRRPSVPVMLGHQSGMIRPNLPGLHSVIAPVRSMTG